MRSAQAAAPCAALVENTSWNKAHFQKVLCNNFKNGKDFSFTWSAWKADGLICMLVAFRTELHLRWFLKPPR